MASFTDILTKYSSVDTNYGTDKITSHSYGSVYNTLFDMYRGCSSILEIGFDGGAALQAYSEYFKNATIYGIDIDDRRLPYVKENPRIRTFIGDATVESTINHFGRKYDVIIEDASHTLEHQIQHFKDYSKFVNPGGIYVIEDINGDNLESLKLALLHFSLENGFTHKIYDLRSKKGRFDDILIVFTKIDADRLKRFLSKVVSVRPTPAMIECISRELKRNTFEHPVDPLVFLAYLTNPSLPGFPQFLYNLYSHNEWILFCELFLYPLFCRIPEPWNDLTFTLSDYDDQMMPTVPDGCKSVNLDIGLAFNAPHTSLWINEDPNVYVLGFEPNPTNLKYIHMPYSETTPPPNYPYPRPPYWLDSKYIPTNLQVFPIALSDEIGTTEFYCTNNDPGTSSLYKPCYFDLEKVVTVKRKTLNSILFNFPWHRVPYINLMKIDAQGHDFEILLGSVAYLDRVAYINVEMSCEGQYEGVRNKYPYIDLLLRSQGFACIDQAGGNGTFINTNLLDYCKTVKPSFINT